MESHLSLMDRARISRSIISITSPGTYLCPGDQDLCRKITRETNIDLSEISRACPDRFSFFASLPLPDVEGAIEEIDYALDHLGAIGFILLTNSNGVYLGDPLLDKVFKKLDERKAVVMIHPTTCQLCPSSDSHWSQNFRAETSLLLPQYPRPMFEFFFDTTRAVVHLILSKSVERHPKITFIVPHCGSVLPSLVERFTSYSVKVSGENAITSDNVREIFKTRFYFDLAGFPFPDQIHGLLRFADASRFLYGTDFPFFPANAVVELAEKNDSEIQRLFTAEESKQIYYENARRLLALD